VLEYPNQSNVDNPNAVRHEASRHFKNKNKEYLKAKIDELEIIGKLNNIRDLYRGISDFKKGYQPRPNTVKDEKANLVTDSHSSVARWRNHFSQLLNVHGADDVGQTERHTADPLVPEPSAFEAEMAVGKLKRHISPGTDQIPAELFKAEGRTIYSEIHKLINSIWNYLRSGKSRSLYPSITRVTKQIAVITEVYNFVNYVQNFIQHPAVKASPICTGNYWGSSV
jgi:hypothetical protein